MEKEGRNMQMYAMVTAGLLGLLIGFWLGRSIRWNMEETEEEAVNRQEERRITGTDSWLWKAPPIKVGERRDQGKYRRILCRTQRKKRRMTI